MLGNFQIQLFAKNSFQKYHVSNSLDHDQAPHFVGADLGANCLQNLSADNKSGLAGKELNHKMPFALKQTTHFVIYFQDFLEKNSCEAATRKGSNENKDRGQKFQNTMYCLLAF